MSMIEKMRKQTATYWAFTGNDGLGGRTFAAAVQIDCRWEDVVTQIITSDGEEAVSQATVYMDRAAVDGSYLKRGDIDPSPPADPTGEADCYPILRREELPNLKNTETLYTVYL